MVRITLLRRGVKPCGFRISGHAGGVAGSDIVCAAISSAAILAANTVTEACGCRAVVRSDDGYLFLSVVTADLDRCEEVLEGLRQHFEELQRQYPNKIQVGTVVF